MSGLHRALLPAKPTLARTRSGAVHSQEFPRLLLNHSADWLRQEIQRMTGVEYIGRSKHILFACVRGR
jgi:hypothetical protein